MNVFKAFWKRGVLRLPGFVRFIPIYLREMTLSNIRVAVDALRPNPRFKPGFVEISVAGYDPIERWEAACLITMTPGTLVLDLKEGSDEMLVHALYLSDPAEVKNELEALLRQAMGKR